ncbi:GntR family transcriptional regulator [Streptosporangium carneum]|uniref:Transcriptional regulator n=2 Tax=Bacteria TaxID=2 RepID=A0A9W6HVH0_9ACTN|nr:GntR family transcriptional regulator [Streptosporangium carneum]GLK07080.1 transcriptional regulator [Streptosporangium carneum]
MHASVGKTRSEEIRQRIADDIVSGRLKPGQKLDEPALAEHYQVSRTPVRDALRQLSGTGLVRILPKRGAWVAEIDPQQLDELFEACAEIDALCAKLAAVRLTGIERRQLELAHTQSEDYVSGGDDAGYAVCNEKLHDLIYQGSRNRALVDIARGLRQRAAPFRLPQFYVRNERMNASFKEHALLVKAVEAGDAEAAYVAMHTHITNSSVHVIEFFKESMAVW